MCVSVRGEYNNDVVQMDDSDLEVIEENGKSYRKIPDDFKNTDTITKTGPHSFTLHYLD